MGTLANPDLLTPNILFQSGIHLQSKDGSPTLNEETINVSVCSEFTAFHTPATTVDSSHKPSIALDTANTPVIFTVGNEGRLFCIRRVEVEHWKTTDITPGGSSTTVVTFDVYQYSTGEVAIAVATTASTIYVAKPFVLTNDFDLTKIVFSQILVSKQAVSMTIAASDAGLEKPYSIIVGTRATLPDGAIDYVISTGSDASKAWEPAPKPKDAVKVLKVLPVMLPPPYDAYVASLYQQNGSNDIVFSCLPLESNDSNPPIYLNLGEIAGGRDMATIVTGEGLSDLFIAGVQGIGYFTNGSLYCEPPLVLLPNVSFRQIVASENECNIGIFAVSTDGDLYYIEGIRETATSTPNFYGPTYPIKKYVGGLSTQYNAGVNACDVMYIDNTNHLKHLWRDCTCQTWSEQTIHVQDLNTSTSYPAFISKIHIQGSKGTAISSGYDISLSATELTYAIINDEACRLDKDPAKFNCDADGTIHIVIQASPQLGAPTITAVLHGEKDSNYKFYVEPRQRVLRNWGNVRSGSSLKNAKSTDGKLIFPDTKIHDDSFNAAAELMQHAPSMVAYVDKNAPALTGTNTTATPVAFSVQKINSTHHSSTGLDWIESAEKTLHAIGDFFESVWNDVVDVTKIAVKTIDNVVHFFAEVAGKALRWVLDTVGTVIRCVCTFLKNVLGIDLSRFLALFGFLFDYPNVLETQQVIVKTVKDGCSLLQGVVKDNTRWIETYIQQLRPLVSQYIKDERVPQADGFMDKAKGDLEDSFLGKLLKSVLDNPIINTVMRYASMWMLQVVSLLEEEIHFPGLDDLEKVVEKLTTLLEKFVNNAEADLVNLIKNVFNGFVRVISGKQNIGEMFSVVFSDVFWSIFNIAQDVALALIDILSDLIGGILKAIISPIKFPGISAFWEAFTETPFSIVDVGSMIVAQVLYLVTMMWKGKLPFEIMTPWYLLLPQKDFIRFRDNNTEAYAKIQKAETIDEQSAYAAVDSEQLAYAAEPEQSENLSLSDRISPFVVFDLGISTLSSFFSTANTALGALMLFPKGRMEGYDMNAFEHRTTDRPEIRAKTTALPTVQRAQTVFSGLGLLARATLLVSGGLRLNLILDNDPASITPRVALMPVFKTVALAMNEIGFVVRLSKTLNGQWVSYLGPIGNIIGTLPGGIWTFVDSEKNATDIAVLETSIMNTAAAGCDILTTVTNQLGEPEVSWGFFFISAGFDITQAIATFIIGFQDLK